MADTVGEPEAAPGDDVAAQGSKPSRRLRTFFIIAGALVGLLLVAVVGVAIAASQFAEPGRIARNATIEGIAVSGLTPSEAAARLQAEWVPALPRKVRLVAQATNGPAPGGSAGRNAENGVDDVWLMAPEDLGRELLLAEAAEQALAIGRTGTLAQRTLARLRTWRRVQDVQVRGTVDEEELNGRLTDLQREVDREPVNARVEVDGEQVRPIRGRAGLKLDVEAARRRLLAALQDPATREVPLPVTVEQPEISADDLQHFDAVLASYTTHFNTGDRNRSHNIRLAAQSLDRQVVLRGKVFSLNEALGPRQPEFGYKDAVTFIAGEISSSSGGGVCQISTTLYNAALLANLKIVRRSHHSMPVHYVPVGRDATVFWGLIDLKFENTLTHPILILASTEGGSLTMRILGYHEDDYDVEILRSGVQTLPYKTFEKPDPKLEAGKREVEKKGRQGYQVTTTRVVRKDGEEIKREVLARDVYRPHAEVVRIGPRPSEGDAASAPGAGRTGAPATGSPAAPGAEGLAGRGE